MAADEEKIREAFAAFDADGSGLIDSGELKAAFLAAFAALEIETDDEKVDEHVEVRKRTPFSPLNLIDVYCP